MPPRLASRSWRSAAHVLLVPGRRRAFAHLAHAVEGVGRGLAHVPLLVVQRFGEVFREPGL